VVLPPQANSEVSALLGRIPSAVGYQPTLATDLGGLQERITTTTKGSITSVQVRAPRSPPPGPCASAGRAVVPPCESGLPAPHACPLARPSPHRPGRVRARR
jgi:hypothetical protein